MIVRSFDAPYLNTIINDPSIRPHIGGDPEIPLDLTDLVADLKNYMLVGKHGGFAFTWTAPETYEVHTFILPEGRGQAALDLAKRALAYMKAEGATHIWTRVERGAENVRRFTIAGGLEPCGEQVLDLGAGPVTYELFNWRSRCL